MDQEEVGGSTRKYAFEVKHAWLGRPWVLATRSEEKRREWVDGLRQLINEGREEVMRREGGRVVMEEEEEEDEEKIEEENEEEEGGGLLERLVWPGYEEEVGTALERILEFAEVRLLSDFYYIFIYLFIYLLIYLSIYLFI
jgi:hypothetical protein